jgi:tRNA(Ile)-lysidine synthase TilS/MesJ
MHPTLIKSRKKLKLFCQLVLCPHLLWHINLSLFSRSKPFKYTYEKEIVMYAYFKKLDYFSTECIYSPNAYRGHARTFIKDLEKIR